MTDKEIKTLEGEVLEQVREKSNGGVFIGTLNIMTEPARNFLTEPLAGIYKNRYHGKFKRPKHVFAFDIGLVALGAALAAVSIYFGLIYKPFEPVSAKLALLPKAPVSGSEVVISLTVSNMSAEMITDVVATFKLPPELKMKRSSLPYQRDSNKVNFDAIAAGAEITERIVADLNGAIGKNLKTTATITYIESGSGKTVTKGANGSVKIAGSSVGAEFQLPENTVVGQEFSGAIRYANRGNAPVDNVVIIPVWPQNFILSSSDPALKNGVWSIGALTPGSEGKLSFSGTIGTGNDAADFVVETGIRSGSDVLIQGQTVKNVNVTDPRITITLDGPAGASLGSTINFTANYKNNGSYILSNVTPRISVDEGLEILNVEKISSGDIAAGASGSFKVTAKVSDKLPERLADATDPQIGIRAILSGKLDDTTDVSISSLKWSLRIATTIDLAAGARYFSDSGDQLGRGPLPPEVGKATKYWIFWNVKNTTGAAGSVRVSGTLPANVSYTGKASVPFGDAPIYDPATRRLTWNVGNVPTWPGVTSPAVNAAFEVSLTPTADQIGTYPLLMTGQTISGIDTTTGIKLAGSAPNATAHLTSDPQAAGTGTVK